MIQYVVLLTGFFVALAVLGVDLTKVTILARAFTVGIEVGLQTVINNFVCGLILIFERPIKVGDVVQVDADIGEVRHKCPRMSDSRGRRLRNLVSSGSSQNPLQNGR